MSNGQIKNKKHGDRRRMIIGGVYWFPSMTKGENVEIRCHLCQKMSKKKRI